MACEPTTFCIRRRLSWLLLAAQSPGNVDILSSPSTGSPRPGANSVPEETDALADWERRKAHNFQAFLKAADGIRTHDLLHGK